MIGIDFLDVDHTLIRHSSGRRFLSLGVRKGAFPLTSVVLVPFYFLRYRFGAMGPQTLNRELPGLKGKEQDFLEELSGECFETSIKKDIYPGAISLIDQLKDMGRKVVLATSSIDLVVRPLAEYLGITELIASSLQFEDGICTGRFAGTPILGYEKMRVVIDFIQRNGGARKECSFYSDSIHDLPLLEVIGIPVAVNPDARLRRVAGKRMWKVVRFR